MTPSVGLLSFFPSPWTCRISLAPQISRCGWGRPQRAHQTAAFSSVSRAPPFLAAVASLKRTGNYPLRFRSRSHEHLPVLCGSPGAEPCPTTPAIAFDIDGVFKHGGKWESRGGQALRKVMEARVPFVFMTNGGGGRTEEEYVVEIARKVQEAEAEGAEAPPPLLHIPPASIVLSYTPFDLDLGRLKDKPVLIVGDPKEKVMNVARSYGYQAPIHITDYDRAHPLMNPFKVAEGSSLEIDEAGCSPGWMGERVKAEGSAW